MGDDEGTTTATIVLVMRATGTRSSGSYGILSCVQG